MFVWKCLHDAAPRYLADMCVPAFCVHGRQQLHSTASGTLLVPRTRTATGQLSFAVDGPRTDDCQLNLENITTFNVADATAKLKEKLKIMVITVDNHLTMDSQVSEICRSPFYHTRALRHMRPVITDEVAKTSACSYVTSRFDYAISVLYLKMVVKRVLLCSLLSCCC